MSDCQELKIDDLLFIEDDVAILEFRCPVTDLLIWPYIRIPIYRMILTDILYLAKLDEDWSTKPGIVGKVRTLSRSLLHNFFYFKKNSKAEVCFVAAGIANEFVDGKWFNRLTGHLAEASPAETLTIEDHFEWRWSFPRSDNRVVFLAPYRAFHTALSIFQVDDSHRHLARSLVQYINQRAHRRFGWEMSEARAAILIRDLARKIASLPMQYRAYRKMLEKINPKVLLVGSASYGGVYSTMIAAARSLNIKTAEYQHGAVSKGHDGYNFSQTMCNSSAFRRVFPDYFLSYGKWWGSQLCMPAEIIVIGNPYRSVKTAKRSNSHCKQQLLILSDGMEFAIFVELAKAIEPTANQQGLSVVIRPHPLERSGIKARYGQRIGTINLDYEPNVFKSLQSVKILVSELSTGLFDAIGLAEHIYMWNTHKSRFSFPERPFQSFSTADELKELVINASHSKALSADEFWAPSWKANYQEFLATLGIGSS